MQQYITEDDLAAVGIDAKEDMAKLLTHLNEQLEERVGTEITESLSDEKLEEYLKLSETASDEEIGKWLQANVPELQQIAQDEIDILLGELAENGDAINETA